MNKMRRNAFVKESLNTSKKTIWIVNQYCSVDNETSRQACMARYLEKLGYDVMIFTSKKQKDKTSVEKIEFCEKNGVKYCQIILKDYGKSKIRRVLSTIEFQRKVVKSVRTVGEAPQILISNFAGIFGNILFKLKKKAKTKIILDILDFWPEVFVDLGYIKKNSIIAKFLYKMEYKSYSRCDSLFFSVQGGKDYIIEKGWDLAHGGKVNADNIFYVNNGIDFNSMSADCTENVFEDTDLDTDKFKVVYVGAIGAPNNIDLLVETAKLAQELKYYDIEFLVYGNGNKLNTVSKLAQSYNLKNIKFKGFVNKKYSPNIISRCNVSILNFRDMPTLRFGISNNKFFLYCVGGKPIISTVKPNYDLVETKNCGIVVKHTPESILDGILQIKNCDLQQYDKYCKNALSVAKEFDYNNILQPLKNEVQRLLNG